MGTLLFIVAVIIYCKWSDANLERRVDDYKIGREEGHRMIKDQIQNNLSYRQTKQNLVNGKYRK